MAKGKAKMGSRGSCGCAGKRAGKKTAGRSGRFPGDVNRDGKIDRKDFRMARNMRRGAR
jgi:hypothetical protein